MKVQITVTDNQGNTYLGEIELTSPDTSSTGKHLPKKGHVSPTAMQTKSIDFTLGVRAFLKRHIPGKASGHQKFVILLAWIAKGDTSKTVDYDTVVQQWNKVKGLTGGEFNPAYTTRAKEANWVDTPKMGAYKLQRDWKAAFGK
jgi:hypothetical protein